MLRRSGRCAPSRSAVGGGVECGCGNGLTLFFRRGEASGPRASAPRPAAAFSLYVYIALLGLRFWGNKCWEELPHPHASDVES
eukprot:scaffold1249_cov122-Isochrysis_galbana.AAC.4